VALNIKSREADRLARELSALTGESITEAVTVALAERLQRCKRPRRLGRRAALRAIRERVSRLPVLDDRPVDELLGYNEFGTFD
jgi:antitoxin VapB